MNFRSSSVQATLIKTSGVGNVSKETGIHRERKNINKTEPHPKEEREQQTKSRWHNGFPTWGFHHLQSEISLLQQERTWSPAITQTHAGLAELASTTQSVLICHGRGIRSRQAGRKCLQGMIKRKRSYALLLLSNTKIKARHWVWWFWKCHCVVDLGPCRYLFNLSNFSINLRFHPPFIFALNRAKVAGITFIRLF